MSDNKDLKSKILLMRQKNFGEIVNEANEKNDNEKLIDAKPNNDEVNTEIDQNTDDINENKVKEDIQYDISTDISELKNNLNKVAKTNERAFE